MPTDSSMIYLKLKSHNSALVIGRCLVLIKMFPLKKKKNISAPLSIPTFLNTLWLSRRIVKVQKIINKVGFLICDKEAGIKIIK